MFFHILFIYLLHQRIQTIEKHLKKYQFDVFQVKSNLKITLKNRCRIAKRAYHHTQYPFFIKQIWWTWILDNYPSDVLDCLFGLDTLGNL
jgi:hypothetical protein